MRIVAGRNKGRVIAAPPGLTARPTADRTRQALFNILRHAAWCTLDDACVVDAFAGSGALGFEALSQGAARVTFFETHPDSAQAIAANAATLGEGGRVTLLRADATRPPPATAPCGLALLDPPYGSGLVVACLTGLAGQGWLAEDAACVVEVAAREPFAPPPGFGVIDERVYGAARLVFLRVEG